MIEQGKGVNSAAKSCNMVLVVIPVFNRSKMIVEALDAVLGQTLRPTEVIVVDDGSTDQTAATVEAWIVRHPELTVTLIRSPNRGASAARNLGFSSRSQSVDFVAFLDSDDFWPRDFLARGVACLSENPQATVTVADRIFIKGDGRNNRFVSSRAFEADPFLQLIRVGAGYGSAALIRASAFEASGGYPEDVPTGHDIILFEKLISAGKCLHNVGSPVSMRTWSRTAGVDQEPHLHLRFPDHYIRWAETYLSVCQLRARRPGVDGRIELRYHLAVAYRFLLALAVEIGRIRPFQVFRILKNLTELAGLMKRTLARLVFSEERVRST